MEKLSITKIEELSTNDIKTMTGEFTFSSYVPMASFVKKLQIAKRSYNADYGKHIITLN